ncbi:MAG: tetratricopeptide repeat protein [Phycisphaerales bacterium]|nr:tetratricopeptide repeat protein [Phycisphaerales bacterium]
MGVEPAGTDSNRILPVVGVLFALSLVIWLVIEVEAGGLPAVRPEPGVVTDTLLSPELDALADAVDASPGNDDQRAALGRAYEANELYEPAAATWRQLVMVDSSDWAWKYRLAVTLERLGDLDAAIAAMQEAARVAPSDLADPRWRLALWLIDAGRLDEAREALEQAEAIDADAVPVRVAKVRLALSDGRAKEAEDMILRYRLTSTLPGGYGWHLMGRALRRQDRVDEARDAWSRTGDVRPRFNDIFNEEMSRAVGGLRALKMACTAQSREGQWTAVLQTASRILRHEPDDVVTRRLQAIAWVRTGNPQRAEAALIKLIDENPSPNTYGVLASAYLAMATSGDGPESLNAALEATGRGLELDPDDSRLLLMQGRALGMLGRPREALDSLRQSWNLDQGHATTLEVAIKAAHEADAWLEALELAEALYRQRPTHPLAGAGYALALAQANRGDEARVVLDSLKGRNVHAQLRKRAEEAVARSAQEASNDP